MMSPGGNQNALEGLKVLDFCWVVAGPMTTKYLAEHGATVVAGGVIQEAGVPEGGALLSGMAFPA